MRDKVNGVNPYLGAVGIFWPQLSAPRELLWRQQFYTSEAFAQAIVNKVQTSLVHRRPTPSHSWQRIVGTLSQQRFAALKKQGSTNIDEWSAAFDAELDAKQADIEQAEREIMRLKAELVRHESAASGAAGILVGGGRTGPLSG